MAGLPKYGPSLAPSNDKAILRASDLVSGIGYHQIGGRGFSDGVENGREPLGRDFGETDRDGFPAAGMKRLGFGLLDDGTAITVGHDQAGFGGHMLGRKIRR